MVTAPRSTSRRDAVRSGDHRRLVEQIRRNPRVTHQDVSAAVLDELRFDLEADGGASLVAANVDGLTLLGNQRALQHDVDAAARHGTPFQRGGDRAL